MNKTFLSENEKQIYIFLLANGAKTVNELSKHVSIDRRSLYDILRRMSGRNLVISSSDGSSKFIANPPQILIHDFKEQMSNFLKEIPLESKLKNEILVYNGSAGIKIIISEILEKRLPHYAYGPVNEFVTVLPIQVRLFIDRLADSGLPEKIIYPDDENIKKIKKGKYKKLSRSKLPPNSVVIYENTVCMLISRPEPKVIIIKSKQVEKEYMVYFNNLWKSIK